MKPAVIVHLSDLHIKGSAQSAFSSHVDSLLADIPSYEPDLIIVTGDLAENPSEGSLEKAKRFLTDLCSHCKLDPNTNLLVVPGNHDYRVKGFLGTRAAFGAFRKAFPLTFPKIWVIDKSDIPALAVFGFDSNTNDDPLNFATGRVDDKQLSDFITQKQTHPQADIIKKAFKIAIVHHHCMPIADSETNRITDRDAFLVMDNAGTFMTEMARNEVDLILHGHKHYRNLSYATLHVPNDSNYTVAVVAAGTACKEGASEFNYNIIKVKPSGEVSLHQRIRSVGLFRSAEAAPLSVRPYSTVRKKEFERLGQEMLLAGVSRMRCLRVKGDGEGLIHDEFRELRLAPGKEPPPSRNKLYYGLKSDSGTYRDLEVTSRVDSLPSPSFSPDTEHHALNSIAGWIVFDRDISESTVFSFDVDCRVLNGFFFTAEDRQAITQDPIPNEFIELAPHAKYKYLTLMVQFPSESESFSFNPEAVAVNVLGPGGQRVYEEELFCLDFLRYAPALKTIVLTVPAPLADHKYRLLWRLPKWDSSSVPKLDPLTEGLAARIIDRLLAQPADQNTAPNQILRPSLLKLRSTILSKWPDPIGAENLDLSLMIFDPSSDKMRCVASTFPVEHWVWRWNPLIGQGVVGQAYRRNEAIFSLVRRTDLESSKAYVRPAGVGLPASEPDPTVIFSIPLRYPVESRQSEQRYRIVGVLNIGSLSETSGLLNLWEKDDLQFKLIDLAYSCYALEFLPALGLPPGP